MGSMMLKDDGNVITAVGYVTIYSSYLEEAVDELLEELFKYCEIDINIGKWRISQKIKKAKILLVDAADNYEELCVFLDSCAKHLNDRNEITHGRIYGSLNTAGPDVLKSGRGSGERTIQSKEVYALANDLLDCQGSVNILSRNVRKPNK